MMKKIKTYYTFLYYALYKSMEIVKPAFWTDFKAILGLATLEVWFCLSVMTYYTVITKKDAFPQNFISHPSLYIFIVLLTLSKVAIFIYKSRWKRYVLKFDAWPRDKVKRWKIRAWIVMFGIVANLVLSMYLLYQIDWSQYR